MIAGAASRTASVGPGRSVKVAGGGVVALDGPVAEAANLFTRPGFVIGETSLVVYFNPDVVPDTSWTRWQAVVTDVQTGATQAGTILNRDDPANACGRPTAYCRALSTSGGWALQAGRVYTVTIRVYLPAGATLDSAQSLPSQARAVIDPPALPADQVPGCSCPNVLTRKPGVQALRADLVNTGTGAYVRTERDAGVSSFGLPFQAVRLYSSTKARAGMFGPGWSWTYDAVVQPLPGGAARAWAEDGASAVFAADGNGGFTRPLRVESRLTRQGAGWQLSTGDQRLLDFDSAGRLIRVTNKRGFGVRLGYDASGHLATATDAAGRVVQFETGPDGQITLMTLADGRTVSYAYTAGLLTSVRDARGLTSRYGYDPGNRLASVTGPDGVVTARVVYGADTRVVSQADGVGSTVRFTWDAATEVATATDDDGVITTDGYRKGLLVYSRNAENNTVNVRYDTRLNANLSVDAVGNQSEVEHDSAGNVTQVRSPDPLGYVESNSYDSANNLKKHKDTRGSDWRYGYNANNDMTEQADPEQADDDDPNTWQGYRYTYDDRGLVMTRTDPRGKVTHYEYDADGNRTAEVSPTGRRTEFTYDSSGRVLSVTDPRGTVDGANAATRARFTTRIGYDAEDRVLSQQDPNKLLPNVMQYDEYGQVAAVTDPLRRTTRWQRDEAGRVTAVIDAKGRSSQYGYTKAGRTQSVTDAAGDRTTWAYETRGRITTEVSPRGNALAAAGAPASTVALYTTTFAYDPAGNLQRSSRPYAPDPTKKVLVDGTFDQLNRPVTQVDELGGTTKVGYDAAGNISSMEDEKKRPLTYHYDKANRRVDGVNGDQVTDARITYDKAGNVTRQVSPTGGITTWSYDDDGRPTAITEPRGNVRSADADDFTTHYAYDRAGNLTSVTDPLGNVSTQVYDGTDRVTESIDANGSTTRAIYDDADQPVAVFGPTAKGSAQDWLASFKAATTSITSKGPVSGTVIAPGSVVSPTSFALTTLAAFFGVPVTRYAYDATGQSVASADQLSRVRRIDYDAVDRPVTSIDPLGRIRRMTYDADGNVTTMRSASNTPEFLLSAAQKAALTSTFTYDPVGWMTERKQGTGPSYTYGYDASGQLTSMGDPAGRTDIGYDETGLVKTVTRGTRQFTYGYDEDDNIASRTYPDGTLIKAEYDVGDRMKDLTTTRGGSSQSFSFAYDPADRLKRTTYPGSTGAVEDLDYDPAGRLSSVAATSGAGVRSDYTLTRDPAGNPTQITTARSDGGGAPTVRETTAYRYDASNRLTDACYGATGCGLTNPFAEKFSYQYDLVGNRTKQVRTKTGGGPFGLPAITSTSYLYDAADQLKLQTTLGTENSVKAFDYDGEGNQTRANDDRFTYNLDHTLASATVGGQSATFSYDGSGSRIASTVGSGASQETRFWEWDTQNALPMLAIESAASGGASAGPAGGKDAPTTRAYTYGAGGQTLALHSGGAGAASASVFTHDWLGGTANVLSANGSAQWSYDYDPFGNPRRTGLTAGGRRLSASAPVNPLQYTGAYNDEAAAAGDAASGSAGNYHLRARDYDPSTGRFTGTDPMSRGAGSAGISSYVYADNRATVSTDPSGMFAGPVLIGGVDRPDVANADASNTDPTADDQGNTNDSEDSKEIKALEDQQTSAQRLVGEAESFIKQLGDEIVHLVMDLIGVTDALACVRDGDIGACISTALNAVPWRKLFKAAKVAIKAIGIGRKLIGGFSRLKAARAALTTLSEAIKVAKVGAKEKALKNAQHIAEKTRALAQKTRRAAAKSKQEAAREARSARAAKQSPLDDVENTRRPGGSCDPTNKPSNSFVGDTRVVMADGSTKAISDIQPGDSVLAGPSSVADEDEAVNESAAEHAVADRKQSGNSVDHSITGLSSGRERTKPRQVTATITGHGVKHLVDLTLVGAGSGGGGPPVNQSSILTTTDGHPLWTTERGWIRAGDLRIDDHLSSLNGANMAVGGVAQRTATITVHNLTIDDRHTYYVQAGETAALVHNSCEVDVEGIEHAVDRHTWDGEFLDAKAGVFDNGVDLASLAKGSNGQIGRVGKYGNIEYTVRSSDIVGVTGRTPANPGGIPTSVYTVVRNRRDGSLVTMFPGVP